MLTFLLVAGTARAQGLHRVEIRDNADMFGAEAVAKAKAQLEKLATERPVPIAIETIEELPKGQTIDAAALRQARQSGGEGIFILAARRDHKIEVLVSKAWAQRIPGSERLAIRGAFVEGFKEGDFDQGLLRGVEKIAQVLS